MSQRSAPTRAQSIGFSAYGLPAIALFWAGMLVGVSVLATSAKFLAPSLSLPVALDVGRHTFEIFNWVEAGLAVALASCVIPRPPARLVYAMAGLAIVAVVLEIAWFRPVLDNRVSVIIAGGHPRPSHLHFVYVLLEGIKLVALLVLGIWSLRQLAGR